MKLSYMREFLVLSQVLNFTKAADQLYMTQPVLSRHVAALEEDLGGKLLERDTHSVRLTPAGNRAADMFQRILDSYEDLKNDVAALSAGSEGVLKIGSPYYWTEDFTEGAASRFMDEYPACTLEIRSCQVTDGFQDLLDRRTDVFVTAATENIADEVRRVAFAEDRLCVVCLASSPYADRSSMRLADLKGVRIVSSDVESGAMSGFNGALLDLLGKNGVEIEDFVYTEQVDTLGLTIRRTGAVAIMPWCVRHMDRSYLRFIPLDDEECTLPMCLYYLMDNDNPLIARYVRIAREVYGAE